MSPPVDPAAPDAEYEYDETPPAVEIPLPPPRANPFELLQYDVRLTRQEAKYGTLRLARRVGKVESDMRKLVGEDGTNGRVGNLLATIGGWKKAVLAVAAGALASVGIAVAAIYGAGGEAATYRLRLEQIEQRSLSNQGRVDQLEKDLLRIRFPAAFGSPSGVQP